MPRFRCSDRDGGETVAAELPKNIKKEQLERVRNHPFPGIAALKTKKGEEEARQHRYTYTHCHMLAAWWVRRGGADVTEVPATIEIDV
jgi:hypothetical protein